MTWGEIQIESLKKMFLNNDDLKIDDLETYKTNKKYKTYIYAMPQACNEAINYITNLIPVIKSYELTIDKERIDLSTLIDDFKCVQNIITTRKWNMETNSVIKFDEANGTAIIYYEANTKIIDSDTETSESIEINKDCVRYIPLYIAAELYKDDDLTLSTVYMNEFMNNIGTIANRTSFVVNNSINPIYTIEG